MNGNELILDVDGDTSITADTDDQIDFKVGGTDVLVLTSTDLTLNGRRILDERYLLSLDVVLMTARSNELRVNQLYSETPLIPMVFS